MKKLLSLSLCAMFVMLVFATSTYATTYNSNSFTSGDGYGTVTKVDDNITNIRGDSSTHVGPFSKASTSKLADGICEKVHVEINPKDLKTAELFEITLGLKNAQNEYVTEAVVMAQKINDSEVALTAGWAPGFKAIVDEEGVYTYQWEMFTKDSKTYVKFTLFKNETVIGTTGKIDFDTIVTSDTKNPIAEQEDVSVKYLWFCNVQVEKGINVYAEYPETEKPPVEEEPKEETYTVGSENLAFTFKDDEGKEFEVSCIDVLKLKDEELEEFTGMTKEEYNELLKMIKEDTSKYGTLLRLYAIEIEANDGTVHTAATGIKIKLTDELKDYDTFKLIYIDEENNFKGTDVVNLKVNGDHLEGTLPHLSVYALVGDKEMAEGDTETDVEENNAGTETEQNSDNPKTGDNGIVLWVALGVISVLGIVGTTIITKRKNNS